MQVLSHRYWDPAIGTCNDVTTRSGWLSRSEPSNPLIAPDDISAALELGPPKAKASNSSSPLNATAAKNAAGETTAVAVHSEG